MEGPVWGVVLRRLVVALGNHQREGEDGVLLDTLLRLALCVC